MHSYPHFMNENTEANEHRNLLKMAHLLRNDVRI